MSEADKSARMPTSAADAGLRRATLEIEVEGRTELVALALRDGEWIATSSDGERDGPHVLAALRALGLQQTNAAGHARSEKPAALPEAHAFAALTEILGDLLTAVVRTGVDEARQAPSVTEALATLKESLPTPAPLGIARGIGRLRDALDKRDAEEVANMLDGTARLVAALRDSGGAPTPRVSAWLGRVDATLEGGARGPREELSDRQLLEVGRGALSGFQRRSLIRRHLLCLRSGQVYREDFDRSSDGTAGPSPRVLRVGLAEGYPGPEPKRIRLMQYEVVPRVTPQELEKSATHARRDFEALTDYYRKSVRAFPALAEPFVLIAGSHYDFDSAADSSGRRIALKGEGGELERLAQLRARAGVRWLAGTLSDEEGIIVLAVHSACVARDGELVFERIH